MILKKIEIDHFGKLNNFTLNLSDGLNFVYGRNEDGKSTVMAFIRMMFYGNVGTSRELAVNSRKRYKPWNGSAMGGAIEFENEGRTYRLEKHFGPTAGKDETELTDLTGGTQIPLDSDEEIGRKFFGMELEGFDRSMFIGRSGGFESRDGKNDGITEKLINLTTSADENVSLKNATDNLNRALEGLISKRGNAGLLIEAREKVTELEQKLREAKNLESAQRSSRENFETLLKIQQAEKERLEAVKENRKAAAGYETELEGKRENERLAERRAELFALDKDKRAEMAALKVSQAEERLSQAMDAAKPENTVNLIPVFGIAGCVFLVAAIVLAITVHPLCALLAIFVPVFFFAEMSALSRKKRMENYRKAAAEKAEKLEDELEQLLETTGQEASEDDKRLETLKKAVNDAKESVRRSELKLSEMNRKLAEDAGLEDEIIAREAELSKLRMELREPDLPISVIVDEKNLAEEKLREYEEKYSALKTALAVMEESADELRQNFGPKLSERTAEIFNGLTGGHYKNVSVSKDFGIKVLADGDSFYHEGAYLSNGTVDQAYFALRLAIIELLCENKERLPLLLDDIFEQYDDSRTADGLVFLKTYADEQEGQVLLFSCHDHIIKKAREIAPGAYFSKLETLKFN